MANVGRLEVGEIVVLRHAVDRAASRWGLADLNRVSVRAIIEEEVRRAVESSQVYDRKPRGFRPYGDSGWLPLGQRFVGREKRGAIVALDKLPRLVVVTCLCPAPKIPGAAPRGRRR